MKPYTSQIIKAGALLPDTFALLQAWDVNMDTTANLTRILSENTFGKATRSRIQDILVILRARYLADPALTSALATLATSGLSRDAIRGVLYFQSVSADLLLHDTVTQFLFRYIQSREQEVRPREVEAWLQEQVDAGRITRPWSTETLHRVAQGLLSTLKDFGVLSGKNRKYIAPMQLPIAAFAFVAFQLSRTQRSGDLLIHDAQWQVFFLAPTTVERLFFEAHQQRLLTYHAAGRVKRIDFPAETIEEYARALVERAN